MDIGLNIDTLEYAVGIKNGLYEDTLDKDVISYNTSNKNSIEEFVNKGFDYDSLYETFKNNQDAIDEDVIGSDEYTDSDEYDEYTDSDEYDEYTDSDEYANSDEYTDSYSDEYTDSDEYGEYTDSDEYTDSYRSEERRVGKESRSRWYTYP